MISLPRTLQNALAKEGSWNGVSGAEAPWGGAHLPKPRLSSVLKGNKLGFGGDSMRCLSGLVWRSDGTTNPTAIGPIVSGTLDGYFHRLLSGARKPPVAGNG